MQDVAHNRTMRHFGVIRMSIVDWVAFPLAHVSRERLSVIRLLRIEGRAIVYDVILDPRVRTGGVIGRVGEREDVLVLPDWKSLDLPKLRIF